MSDIFCYQAHGRPVKNVKFSASKHDRLFSSSYDGTFRCCFFERGSFDEVLPKCCSLRMIVFEKHTRDFHKFQLYLSPDDGGARLMGFDWLSEDTLLVSQSDGRVALVDTREG